MIQKKIVGARNFLNKAGALALMQVLALPFMASAQNVPTVNVPTNIDIGVMLGKISSYFFGIVIVTCVFMILWGAFDLAMSGGDEGKVTSAKQRIKYAAIGVILAAMSMSIVSVLRDLVQA